MSRQTLLFLSTIGTGVAVGLAYDFFRVFRKTTPHKNAFVQLEDLFFWLTATILFFYFMLIKNYGEIRFFSILGVALGMLLYFHTVSIPIVKAAVLIVTFLKRVIASALRIIFFPIGVLLNILRPPVKKLARAGSRHLHTARLYGKIKARKAVKDWNIIRKKV
jgi:spore cortex biosynthesis protein YabQ